MRVLVLGSGVIGTTSAWYLRQAGFEVTVVDRQPGPALETSFANAGQVSPGYSAPWAGPGMQVKALRWLAIDQATRATVFRERMARMQTPTRIIWGDHDLIAPPTAGAGGRPRSRRS